MKPAIAADPTGEVRIDADLVAALLQEQHPNLATMPLRAVDASWDYALFRLGESFVVRLPRQAAAAKLIEVERRWLVPLSEMLPLPISAPLRFGRPGCGFPWPWSVAPWLLGTTADVAPASGGQAVRLAEFLRALHVAPHAEAPFNPYRGGSLADRAPFVEESIVRLSLTTESITPLIRDVWCQAIATPVDVEATWIHGDLHPRNVLTLDGTITGIIDWGGVARGDCATDLASLWMLFPDSAAREAAMRAYRPVSEATWLRARAWAILFAIVLLEAGLSGNPLSAAVGEQTLQRI